ncbi:MAG: CoA transferase [Alphaproteobacteria bacterium HGW-Alphaproteobacteria-5]|nr:MAG: CoA transferase [Alphaproteobacteria bacterium HGW-Alphaproteobacteria-5]
MSQPSKSFGALSDIRILDLTQMLAGPYATMMLADHGAEVIKIEGMGGDITRLAGPFAGDDRQQTHGGYFQSVNRNKQSVCLNLKAEAGHAAFLELVKTADVVVENFRHGVMDRLGLSYESLRAANPALVYGALRGFGDRRTGASPYADWPAFDVVAQAMGGIMGITGPDARAPTKVGPGVGDIIPGMMLSFGILAAVHHARRTGQGQFVDVSMVDSVLATCERMIYQYSVQGRVAEPEGNHHPFICPFGMFPASDGFITIAAPQDSFFATLCEKIGAPHLLDDARFATAGERVANKAELIGLLSGLTSAFTKAELSERLGGLIPFGPVLRMDEIEADRHFAIREMLVEVEQPGSAHKTRIAGVPLKMTGTPGAVRRRGPYLGEDTVAVLARAGLGGDEIQRLLDQGAALQHSN